MDVFSEVFNIVCLFAQSIIQPVFIGRICGKPYRARHIVFYLLCLLALNAGAMNSELLSKSAIAIPMLILYAMNRTVLKVSRPAALLAGTIAGYICQLSFGMMNSIESMIFPYFVGDFALYLLLIIATAAAFAVCIGCYALVLKFISFQQAEQTPYLNLLLLPGLFFFTAELYILHMSYSQVSVTLSLAETGKHAALLLLQMLGLGALLCTLYAYKRICAGFEAQKALLSLEQAAKAQKIYLSEAQMRYEQTKAFRHDIKNHLLILDGMLRKGQLEESRTYLQKLDAMSTALFFPYQTGNPVVDILLGEKLGLAAASHMKTNVSVVLPKSCGIEDVDWCVIFANALDNALNACRALEGERQMSISGKRQGDFYLLEFQNTCAEHTEVKMGTGLSNIQSVAEKYHGAILMQQENGTFSLSVLLNIS